MQVITFQTGILDEKTQKQSERHDTDKQYDDIAQKEIRPHIHILPYGKNRPGQNGKVKHVKEYKRYNLISIHLSFIQNNRPLHAAQHVAQQQGQYNLSFRSAQYFLPMRTCQKEAEQFKDNTT